MIDTSNLKEIPYDELKRGMWVHMLYSTRHHHKWNDTDEYINMICYISKDYDSDKSFEYCIEIKYVYDEKHIKFTEEYPISGDKFYLLDEQIALDELMVELL